MGQIRCRERRPDTRQRSRCGDIDRHDGGVSMWRAKHGTVQLARDRLIVLKATKTSDKTLVLAAAQRADICRRLGRHPDGSGAWRTRRTIALTYSHRSKLDSSDTRTVHTVVVLHLIFPLSDRSAPAEALLCFKLPE
jgi:hypothetical protein